uniref:Major facilitator superfamily (MFS) profile domain-containing protein n=1 Tax=Panagrolaimus superbus TaxID=310955 RepID=A0A914YZN0_9BILA
MLETDDFLVKHIPSHMRSFVVLSASVLFMFTLGIVYTFGNLLPYLVSYLRWKVDPDQTNGSMIWLQSFMTGVPCSMLLGGYLERKIGARKGALIGSFIYTSAIATSYFSLQHSYILLLLTFGIMASLGHGIAYNCVLIQAQRWLPDRVGLASGLVAAGFGSGAFLMSPIETKFINPDNYQVDSDGRIIWGIIMDKTSYQVSMMSACTIGAALMWTLPGVKSLGDKEIFFIWICGMFSVVGATFTLLPSAAHKCFGPKNFGIAYGVLQISLYTTLTFLQPK